MIWEASSKVPFIVMSHVVQAGNKLLVSLVTTLNIYYIHTYIHDWCLHWCLSPFSCTALLFTVITGAAKGHGPLKYPLVCSGWPLLGATKEKIDITP